MWICMSGVLLREREFGVRADSMDGECKRGVWWNKECCKDEGSGQEKEEEHAPLWGLTQGVFPQQLREEGWHWCVGIKLDPLVVWGLENRHTPAAVLEGVPRVPPPSFTPPPSHTHRKNAAVLRSHEYSTPTHSFPALSFQFPFLFPSLSLRSLRRLSSFVYSSSLLSVFYTQLSGGMLSFFQTHWSNLLSTSAFLSLSYLRFIQFQICSLTVRLIVRLDWGNTASGETLWCIHTLSQQLFM